MVSGKKCLLARSSEQNEQMPAEPPVTVTPTGGASEGTSAAKPAFIASSVAYFHPSVFCRVDFLPLLPRDVAQKWFSSVASLCELFLESRGPTHNLVPIKVWDLVLLSVPHCFLLSSIHLRIKAIVKK